MYASVLIVPAVPKKGNAQARIAGIIIKHTFFILYCSRVLLISTVNIDELFPISTIAIYRFLK